MEPRNFAHLVRTTREDMGMSQQVLSEKVGVHFVTISQIEREKFVPSAELIGRLAGALGVDKDIFFVEAGKIDPEITERLSTDLEFVKRVRSLL